MALGQGEIAAVLIKFGRGLSHRAPPIRQRLPQAFQVADAELGLGEASPGAVVVRRKLQDAAGEGNGALEGALLQRFAHFLARGFFLGPDRAPAPSRPEDDEEGGQKKGAGKIHWRELGNTEDNESGSV